MNEFSTGELLFNRKKQSVILTWIVIFVLFSVLVFFYFFSFIPIQGESMENTIFHKQYCLVQRKAFDINRGDIVILDVAEKGEQSHDIVKRVIALSGDKLIFMLAKDKKTVQLYLCKKGQNNFVKLDEPYIKESMSALSNNYYQIPVMQYLEDLETYNLQTTPNNILKQIDSYITYVKNDYIFFLGDNRNKSRDSRFYGTRPLDNVKYKVISVIY